MTAARNDGTRIPVSWPRGFDASTPELSRNQEQSVRNVSGRTVLIVDDDNIVRRSVRRILSRAGYAVIEASSGEDALNVVVDMECPPDLLLTDVIMPGMTGVELAERLKEQLPDIPVIFMSGYVGDALDADRLSADDARFLPKPFTRERILDSVRKSLV